MANTAQCIYCFESLYAALNHQSAPSLDFVEETWSKYHSQQQDESNQEGEVDGEHSRPESDQQPPSKSRRTNNGSSTPSTSKREDDIPAKAKDRSPSSTSNSSSSKTSTPASASSASISTQTSASTRGGNSNTPFRQDSPLFVTWNTVGRSSHGKSLRGCIGTFEAQKLESGLQSYALTAAFEDHRFNPISASELPNLDCGVTLLTDFEDTSAPLDWDIDTHGIRISFKDRGQRFGATYLPDVAKEQGWTKVEAMVSLMRKAGWKGRSDDWDKVADLKVVRYQGKKASASYEEWRDWRAYAGLGEVKVRGGGGRVGALFGKRGY